MSGAVSLPNDGSGVHVYVIDTGTRISHNQFKNADGTSRASYAYDSVDDDNNPNTPSNSDGPGLDNVDCEGHGTLVSSILGGNSTAPGEVSMGVAKGVTLHSVRAIYDKDRITGARSCGGTGVQSEVLAGMDWVAANALKPAVANLSFGCKQCSLVYDPGAKALTDAGVTTVAASGNYTQDVDPPGQPDLRVSPAHEPSVITVGGSRSLADDMQFDSDYGKRIDLFAPGRLVPGAAITNDSATGTGNGTSVAAPHVAGIAAMYLHDHPSGTASLPWVVKQVLTSNANICPYDLTCVKVNNRQASAGTPDRLAYSNFFSATSPMPANPIDNQRFFVWQHYVDFLTRNPDESGLDFWTRNITSSCFTVTDNDILAHVNDNNSCTHDWRINTSLAFWVDKYPSMFTTSYGLTSGNNSQFVKLCYSIYLKFDNADQRDPNGFGYWKGVLDSYGDPASPTGVRVLIDSFLNSTGPGIPPGPPGYRVLFGAS